MQEVAIIAAEKKSLTIIRFKKKSCTLPCEKKGTEEELEHKRVMVKFSADGIVMKDDWWKNPAVP